MNETDVQRCASWFAGYCGSFRNGVPEDERNYLLKEEHTFRVRENARSIAEGIGLPAGDIALAEVIGLFHDVGRFPQFRDYRTFRDSESVNHAGLGAAVLLEQKVLAGLPADEQDLVVKAVALHNAFTLPTGLDERTLLFVRIVRDADKLDIWRIFAGLMQLPEAERPSAAGLGLPETAEYTQDVLLQLKKHEMVRLASLRTLNDFKLLQLAWVYDLNFLPSLRMVRERDIIDILAATLPRDATVLAAIDAVRQYIDGRLAEAS